MKYIKLFESYKSQKDLKLLTDVLLSNYSDTIIENIEHKFYKMSWSKMPKENLYINEDMFGELKDFILQNRDLYFEIVNKEKFYNYKNGEKAHYVVFNDKEGNQVKQFIELIGDSIFEGGNSIVDDINDCINKWDGDWDKTEYKYSDEKYESSYHKMTNDISRLFKKYHSSLLHELQHAYDNWRSGGKYQADKTSYVDNDKVARDYSKKLFIDGTWDKAKYPLTWLIDKFSPVPEWSNA